MTSETDIEYLERLKKNQYKNIWGIILESFFSSTEMLKFVILLIV